MRIDVYSDVICPWCWLGKRRLEAALADRAGAPVEIHWHPFELNAAMPEGGKPRKAYLAQKFGDLTAFEDAQRRLTELGTAEGIDYRFDDIPLSPNTRAAHALLAIAGEHGVAPAMAEALFAAYFRDARDIGDLETLVALAAACGLPADEVRERLAARTDWPRIEKAEREAQALGVTGVPFFVFDGRYAVSGAQEAATFRQVLDHVERAAATG